MRKKNKAILSFESVYPELEYSDIKPARSFIPKWYKDIPQNISEYPPKDASIPVKSVKSCMPFIDAMSCGYMITLPFDLVVAQENGFPRITWKFGGDEVFAIRNNSGVPCPTGFYPLEFVLKLPMSFMVPVGYNVLYTQPLNRTDLPFMTLSGIIKGGFATTIQGNFPVYVKNNFEGIINQGTPIAQLIPFREEKWNSKLKKNLLQEANKNFNRSTALIHGWYKKTHWTKQEYN